MPIAEVCSEVVELTVTEREHPANFSNNVNSNPAKCCLQ